MEKIKQVHFTNEYGLKDTWTYRGNRLIKTEFRYPRINNKKKIMSLKENNNGSTKASQARARKAAGEIKKLITPYKKANMEEVR